MKVGMTDTAVLAEMTILSTRVKGCHLIGSREGRDSGSSQSAVCHDEGV